MASQFTVSISSGATERKITSVLDAEIATDSDLLALIGHMLFYIDELTGDKQLQITLSTSDKTEKTTIYGDPDKIAVYLARCIEGFEEMPEEGKEAEEPVEDYDGDPHDESTPGFEPFIDYNDLD